MDQLLEYDPSADSFDISHLTGESNTLITLAHKEATLERDTPYWLNLAASEKYAHDIENGKLPQDFSPPSYTISRQVIVIPDDSDDDEQSDSVNPLEPFT